MQARRLTHLERTGSDRIETEIVVAAGALGADGLKVPTELSDLVSLEVDGQISNVPLGTHDAVGFVQDLTTPGPERVFLRRNQDVTDLGTIDFSLTNSEVVAAGSATITVDGLMGGESYFAPVGFNTSTTSNMCQAMTLSSVPSTTPSTFSALGVPSGSQVSDESYTIGIAATDANNNLRSVFENIGSLAPATVMLPAAIPAPTITDLAGPSGPYKILSAVVAMPNAYDSFSSFEYDADGKYFGVAAPAAYLGGGPQTLTVPDLSGVTGFQTTWAPTATDEWSWAIFGTGGFLTDPCTLGDRSVAASIEGTQN